MHKIYQSTKRPVLKIKNYPNFSRENFNLMTLVAHGQFISLQRHGSKNSAMRGHLLTQENFKELAFRETVSDALEYLKGFSSYSRLTISAHIPVTTHTVNHF